MRRSTTTRPDSTGGMRRSATTRRQHRWHAEECDDDQTTQVACGGVRRREDNTGGMRRSATPTMQHQSMHPQLRSYHDLPNNACRWLKLNIRGFKIQGIRPGAKRGASQSQKKTSMLSGNMSQEVLIRGPQLFQPKRARMCWTCTCVHTLTWEMICHASMRRLDSWQNKELGRV